MEKFAIGILLGGVAGALLTANNYKMRTLVKKGQQEAKAKFDQIMDDKIEKMEKTTEALQEEVAGSADTAAKKIKKVAKKA